MKLNESFWLPDGTNLLKHWLKHMAERGLNLMSCEDYYKRSVRQCSPDNFAILRGDTTVEDILDGSTSYLTVIKATKRMPKGRIFIVRKYGDKLQMAVINKDGSIITFYEGAEQDPSLLYKNNKSANRREVARFNFTTDKGYLLSVYPLVGIDGAVNELLDLKMTAKEAVNFVTKAVKTMDSRAEAKAREFDSSVILSFAHNKLQTIASNDEQVDPMETIKKFHSIFGPVAEKYSLISKDTKRALDIIYSLAKVAILEYQKTISSKDLNTLSYIDTVIRGIDKNINKLKSVEVEENADDVVQNNYL